MITLVKNIVSNLFGHAAYNAVASFSMLRLSTLNKNGTCNEYSMAIVHIISDEQIHYYTFQLYAYSSTLNKTGFLS